MLATKCNPNDKGEQRPSPWRNLPCKNFQCLKKNRLPNALVEEVGKG